MKTIRRLLANSSQLLRQQHLGTLAVMTTSSLYLAGCAVEPVTPTPARTVPTVATAAQVYIYPTRSQSTAQLDRDRYECHQWASQQIHFDPSTADDGASVAVTTTAVPGVNTATGALAGAVLGGVIGAPHDAAVGILAGAITGAAIGVAADSSQQRSIEQQQDTQRYQHRLGQAQNYARALSACLEGRGYTVK